MRIDGVRWHVSDHAIARFQERVSAVDHSEALWLIHLGIKNGRVSRDQIFARANGHLFRLRFGPDRKGDFVVLTVLEHTRPKPAHSRDRLRKDAGKGNRRFRWKRHAGCDWNHDQFDL